MRKKHLRSREIDNLGKFDYLRVNENANDVCIKEAYPLSHSSVQIQWNLSLGTSLFDREHLHSGDILNFVSNPTSIQGTTALLPRVSLESSTKCRFTTNDITETRCFMAQLA